MTYLSIYRSGYDGEHPGVRMQKRRKQKRDVKRRRGELLAISSLQPGRRPMALRMRRMLTDCNLCQPLAGAMIWGREERKG
jgi:hypothetical protein